MGDLGRGASLTSFSHLGLQRKAFGRGGVARRRGLPVTGGYLVRGAVGLGGSSGGEDWQARRVKIKKVANNASHKANHATEFILTN